MRLKAAKAAKPVASDSLWWASSRQRRIRSTRGAREASAATQP